MACKTEHELKRELRKAGMSPERTAHTIELLKQYKESVHADKQTETQLGDRNADADSAYANLIKAKEDKIVQQMGGTIKIGNTNYDIKSLRINSDNVTIRMQKGDSIKTYSFPFGSSTSLPTAKGKVVTTSYLHLYTDALKSSGSESFNTISLNEEIADVFAIFNLLGVKVVNNKNAEAASVADLISLQSEIFDSLKNGYNKKLLQLIADKIKFGYVIENEDAHVSDRQNRAVKNIEKRLADTGVANKDMYIAYQIAEEINEVIDVLTLSNKKIQKLLALQKNLLKIIRFGANTVIKDKDGRRTEHTNGTRANASMKDININYDVSTIDGAVSAIKDLNKMILKSSGSNNLPEPLHYKRDENNQALSEKTNGKITLENIDDITRGCS